MHAAGIELHRERLLSLLGVPDDRQLRSGASFYVARTAPANRVIGDSEPLEFSVGFYEDDDDPRVECDVSALTPSDRELSVVVVARPCNGIFMVPEHFEREYRDFLTLLEQARARGLVFIYAGNA
jgi:hypothetical protein